MWWRADATSKNYHKEERCSTKIHLQQRGNQKYQAKLLILKIYIVFDLLNHLSRQRFA